MWVGLVPCIIAVLNTCKPSYFCQPPSGPLHALEIILTVLIRWGLEKHDDMVLGFSIWVERERERELLLLVTQLWIQVDNYVFQLNYYIRSSVTYCLELQDVVFKRLMYDFTKWCSIVSEQRFWSLLVKNEIHGKWLYHCKISNSEWH